MKLFALLLLAVVLTEGIDLEKKIFDSFDFDGNGFLTASEMRYLLTAVGMAEVDMDKIIKGVDSNGDGQIDFPEFLKADVNNRDLSMIKKAQQAYAEAEAALGKRTEGIDIQMDFFQNLDLDSNGFIYLFIFFTNWPEASYIF